MRPLSAAPLVFALLASTALADEPPGLSVNPYIDIPLTVAPLSVWGAIYALGVDERDTSGIILGDQPTGIDGLSPFNEHNTAAKNMSDLIMYGSIFGGAIAAAWDGHSDGMTGGRVLLYAETFSWIAATTELVKVAVERPRPYTHDIGIHEVEDLKSFFSGHTSYTAATMFTTARALDLTGDLSSPQRSLLYGGASLLTLGAATTRVLAGEHYVSDVAVGALVGASVGWLVPELHRGDSALTLSPMTGPDGEQGLAITGRW